MPPRNCTPPTPRHSVPAMPAVPTPAPFCDEAEAFISDIGSYHSWCALYHTLKGREVGTARTIARRKSP